MNLALISLKQMLTIKLMKPIDLLMRKAESTALYRNYHFQETYFRTNHQKNSTDNYYKNKVNSGLNSNGNENITLETVRQGIQNAQSINRPEISDSSLDIQQKANHHHNWKQFGWIERGFRTCCGLT